MFPEDLQGLQDNVNAHLWITPSVFLTLSIASLGSWRNLYCFWSVENFHHWWWKSKRAPTHSHQRSLHCQATKGSPSKYLESEAAKQPIFQFKAQIKHLLFNQTWKKKSVQNFCPMNQYWFQALSCDPDDISQNHKLEQLQIEGLRGWSHGAL